MSSARKHRFAMYWASSCGGCDISVINIGAKILDFAERFEIVFWPAIMDAKYSDVEQMDDGSIDVTLFSGSIRTTENLHVAQSLAAQVGRARSLRLVRQRGLYSRPGEPDRVDTRILDLPFAFEGSSTDNPEEFDRSG